MAKAIDGLSPTLPAGDDVFPSLINPLKKVPVVRTAEKHFIFKPLLYELLSDELKLWEVAPEFAHLASELGFIYLQEAVISVDKYNRKDES